VVGIVFGDGTGVGEPLVAHPDVDMVTFTGSRAVGERVAAIASRGIKRVALELGGKSAAIILDDAPVADSVTGVLRSCFANTGQTCAALTRVLVPASMAREWESAAVQEASHWEPGDPRDATTAMGPVVSERQRERVVAHIGAALEDGARLVTGGAESPLPAGAYVRPTIFADVAPGTRLFRDEVFGPVLAITAYATLDEAITLANDSDYGLSGGVWSADERRALEVALRLRTGTVGINGAGLDVGAPFGGYKQSGLGREAGARGFEEFLELKSVMGAAAFAADDRPGTRTGPSPTDDLHLPSS
jgi:acyl-CoA reductase-like NAD-dependent aldehyde dehydrogenase